MRDGPSRTELAIAADCQAGSFSSAVAVRLMQLAELFGEFGDPDLTVTPRCGHLTWRVAGVTATLSASDGGFWGVSLNSPYTPVCYVGTTGDPESLLDFRAACVGVKAVFTQVLIQRAM